MTPPIRRVWRNHALAIGKRVVAVFVDPIEGLFYVPERDAIVLWTRTFYRRGITCNLFCYSGAGQRRWKVAPTAAGPNGDRYYDAGVWDHSTLLALSFSGLAVIDFDRGVVLGRPRL